jgi:hypothetical protein
MRLIALLILLSLAFAAPTPRQADKPDVELPKLDVELKLSADNQNALEITIQNNGQEPLELPYQSRRSNTSSSNSKASTGSSTRSSTPAKRPTRRSPAP